jgi:hypothetical protein
MWALSVEDVNWPSIGYSGASSSDSSPCASPSESECAMSREPAEPGEPGDLRYLLECMLGNTCRL